MSDQGTFEGWENFGGDAAAAEVGVGVAAADAVVTAAENGAAAAAAASKLVDAGGAVAAAEYDAAVVALNDAPRDFVPTSDSELVASWHLVGLHGPYVTLGWSCS